MAEDQVIIHELEDLPDGTVRLGNSRYASKEEATSLIEQKKAKAEDSSIGVVPEEWRITEAVGQDDGNEHIGRRVKDRNQKGDDLGN